MPSQCPECGRTLTLGEYFWSTGMPAAGHAPRVARGFGFYTCPACGTVSAKPRVVIHVWAQAFLALLGFTVLPAWAWLGAAVGLGWAVGLRPKLVKVDAGGV